MSTRRKPRPRRRSARTPTRRADSPALVVLDMGQAHSLEYRRDGKTYRHAFTGKTRKEKIILPRNPSPL